MLLLLQCHNPTPQGMTGEKYTLGKGGKGTFKKYLMPLLQTFKYELDSDSDLLEPAVPSLLPAPGKQSHGMRVKLLHGQCSTVWWDLVGEKLLKMA